MKKSILNLGKALNKTEQKNINGGGPSGPNDTCYRYNRCMSSCMNNSSQNQHPGICHNECQHLLSPRC